METDTRYRYEPFGIEIPPDEQPFDRAAVKTVITSPDGWSVSTETGWGTFVPKLTEDQPAPQPGDLFEVFGALGHQIQGQRVAGRVIYWRDREQREAARRRWLEDYAAEKRRRFVRERDRLDRDYAALPPLFKDRIDRFRAESPDFRVESESYELFACTQAVVIADALLAQAEPAGTMDAVHAAIDSVEPFTKMGWEEQKALVPGLDGGHSGNTFAGSCALARILLKHRAGETVSV